jgi:hypothetical protein
MESQKTYTLEEAQHLFAKGANGKVWQLLGKGGRSPQEDGAMLEAAYASQYHWRSVGGPVHWQRGEWLLAHVYTVLGEAKNALAHAQECLDLSRQHPGEMKDFDTAYAYEGMGRALALSGKAGEAREFYALAKTAGEKIANEEDREIFMGDFGGGEWWGIGNE